MRELLGIVAYLALPLLGWAAVRLAAVRRLPIDGRIGVMTACGALFISVALAVLSFAGLRWTRLTVLLLGAVIAGVGWWWQRGASASPAPRRRVTVAGVATWLFVALVAYAALSARMTSGDTSFFWAPKGIAFYRAGAIDVTFLRDPNYFLMHSDYPPLLPLVFVWTQAFSGHFAWFAAVLSAALFLACTVGVLRSMSGDTHRTMLASAILSYAYVRNYVGGGADPLLLLFEAVALCALSFLPAGRAQAVLIALGLAGSVLTKVEGAQFVIAVAVVLVLYRQSPRAIAIAVAPAAILIGGWIAFVLHHQLLDTYRGPSTKIYWSAIPVAMERLVAHTRFDALWLPWLVPLILIGTSANWRRAVPALLVSVLLLGALVYVYIHHSDPVFAIDSSANRTLLPPLLALCVAMVAASRNDEPAITSSS